MTVNPLNAKTTMENPIEARTAFNPLLNSMKFGGHLPRPRKVSHYSSKFNFGRLLQIILQNFTFIKIIAKV